MFDFTTEQKNNNKATNRTMGMNNRIIHWNKICERVLGQCEQKKIGFKEQENDKIFHALKAITFIFANHVFFLYIIYLLSFAIFLFVLYKY